jgi:diguanylate cyclase
MTSSVADRIDLEHAASVARQAFDLMQQHRVPPTPDNFAVWHRYASGTSAQLTQAIGGMIANEHPFDATTNRTLHRLCLEAQAADHAVDAGMSERLAKLMLHARHFLTSAIDDNRTQMRALDGVVTGTAGEPGPRHLIESLVAELSKATSRALTLEANLAETSIELGKIRESLHEAEQRSKTDTLTGLANRHALEEFLTTAQEHAVQSGTCLTALMIDIDHFKSFNDSYGHMFGDQVLKLMASALRESIRDNALAARYGGEELVAVLPGVDLQACQYIAERLRTSVAERRIRRRTTGEEISSITISIGVAELRPGEAADNLIDRCDRALYRAKREGRNRVMTEKDLDEVAAA